MRRGFTATADRPTASESHATHAHPLDATISYLATDEGRQD